MERCLIVPFQTKGHDFDETNRGSDLVVVLRVPVQSFISLAVAVAFALEQEPLLPDKTSASVAQSSPLVVATALDLVDGATDLQGVTEDHASAANPQSSGSA